MTLTCTVSALAFRSGSSGSDRFVSVRIQQSINSRVQSDILPAQPPESGSPGSHCGHTILRTRYSVHQYERLRHTSASLIPRRVKADQTTEYWYIAPEKRRTLERKQTKPPSQADSKTIRTFQEASLPTLCSILPCKPCSPPALAPVPSPSPCRVAHTYPPRGMHPLVPLSYAALPLHSS